MMLVLMTTTLVFNVHRGNVSDDKNEVVLKR